MTDVRSFGQRREREVEVNEEGNSSRSEQPRRRRRLPRIDQEIELYCNPFVEVHLRLSGYLQKVVERTLVNLTDMALVVQDNILLRHIFFIANYTMS